MVMEIHKIVRARMRHGESIKKKVIVRLVEEGFIISARPIVENSFVCWLKATKNVKNLPKYLLHPYPFAIQQWSGI